MENKKKSWQSWRGRFNSLISEIQKKRGDASEARFYSALVVLVRAGFIKQFIYTNNQKLNILKKLDYMGIDFVVFKNDGSAITVQIKSSDTGIKKFQNKHLSGIKVVKINSWESIEETLEKAIEAVFDGEVKIEQVLNKLNLNKNLN